MMQDFQSPLIRQFVAHWKQLCPPGDIPTTEDYMDNMNPKVAKYLMIFDVFSEDMIVRFQGEGISERRQLEQTGKSWFTLNPHLDAPAVLHNVWHAIQQPCGVWTEAIFVTNVQRRLRVEALSLPLRVKEGRPPRILNTSIGLDTMSFDERAMGWQGSIKIGWHDAGFGVPNTPALPVS
jgi:hypothetical protein